MEWMGWFRRRAARELRQIRLAAEADAVRFGEELARLPGPRELDDAARHDYQTALDAYESAKRAIDRLRMPESVTSIVDTLTEGRYALACVRARIAGAPLPQRRTPCFFDPRHGPASTELVWTPHNGPTRKVSACAQDAARIRAGDEPPLVRYGEQQVPRWEANAPVESYRIGFFASSGARAHVIALRSVLKGEGGGDWGNGLGRPIPRRPYD
jgi:hypothetical protein